MTLFFAWREGSIFGIKKAISYLALFRFGVEEGGPRGRKGFGVRERGPWGRKNLEGGFGVEEGGARGRVFLAFDNSKNWAARLLGNILKDLQKTINWKSFRPLKVLLLCISCKKKNHKETERAQ